MDKHNDYSSRMLDWFRDQLAHRFCHCFVVTRRDQSIIHVFVLRQARTTIKVSVALTRGDLQFRSLPPSDDMSTLNHNEHVGSTKRVQGLRVGVLVPRARTTRLAALIIQFQMEPDQCIAQWAER